MLYFQDLILKLQNFWAEQGCILLQPYDMEVGAGTSHPATTLRALSETRWNIAYVQPCRRPTDGRYAENPNRMQHYYQFQALLKPSPDNIQDLCIASLEHIGVSGLKHDIRFIEDDWENPTLGAWGLGWEMWCDGMEVLQFTYMQQIGGFECRPVAGELTYGLERLAMYIQQVDNVWDLKWNKDGVLYKDVFMDSEKEYCKYNFESANPDKLRQHFEDAAQEAKSLLGEGIIQPAYDQCLKAAHLFNLLEARGVLSVTERASFISKVRDITRLCCTKWKESYSQS